MDVVVIEHIRLLSAIAQGDEMAFAQFYDATSAKIYGLVLYILRDRQSAEEVTLDVYLQVWQRASNYSEERGAPLAWLTMLARSRAIDKLRTRRRDPHVQITENNLDVSDNGSLPDIQAIDIERNCKVRAALCQLQVTERQAVYLAYFSGMSHQEIANYLTLPLGTVKTHIRNGLQRLHGLLKQEEGT